MNLLMDLRSFGDKGQASESCVGFALIYSLVFTIAIFPIAISEEKLAMLY